MSAAVFDIEILQGATFERRLYFTTQRIVTATAGSALVGATSIPIVSGGLGAIVAGDHVLFSGHSQAKTYIVSTGVADLSAGGTLVLSSPITEVVSSDSISVYTPMDLTGATFESQVRSTADSTAIVATLTDTLAGTPTLGYIDISLTAAQTAAIPTTGETYKQKSTYYWDGELVISSKKYRSYNGKVTVSPEVTR